MKNSPHTTTFSGDKPRGEAFVWLASAGLGVAVFMIIGLLGLITFNGVGVFWPNAVVEITVREDSGATVGGSRTFAGRVVKKQIRAKAGIEEWQLFVGNKESYGSAFKYLDVQDIAEIERPEKIMVAERMEYGDAVFYPKSFISADGEEISATTPEFRKTLDTAVDEAAARYKRISELEKDEIGHINREMNNLKLERRHLERREAQGEDVDKSRYAEIEGRLEELETAFQELAAQARELRERQRAETLVYRLPSGEEKREPIGHILNYHFPNRMDFLEKAGFFVQEFWAFLSERPREANTEGGIFPAIFGTFVMTVLMSAAVMPFGVVAAIYLREYAYQGMFVRGVRIAVNNLAGVPSIVFGVFGLGFFVYFVGGTVDALFFPERLPTATFGTGGILWASLTLALMTVPVVIVSTEEALAAVPRGSREASLACGASKWQTIQRVVLPASAPGILTGLILAMARGAGEVAPLMLIGVVKLAPSLPVDGVFPFIHLERKFMHLGFHIYDLGFQSPDSEAARPMVFATTFLLILLVIVLNLGAIIIRSHLKKKYATSTF